MGLCLARGRKLISPTAPRAIPAARNDGRIIISGRRYDLTLSCRSIPDATSQGRTNSKRAPIGAWPQATNPPWRETPERNDPQGPGRDIFHQNTPQITWNGGLHQK
jgi:hypothetical protein